MKKLLVLLLLPPLITGCATYIARTGNPDARVLPCFYPATYIDAVLIGAPCNPNSEWGPMRRRLGATCIGVVDMPFSLATDTICLPFDFAGHLSERSKPTLEERREFRDKSVDQTQKTPAR